MKMTKKILTLLLVLALICGLAPAAAFAAPVSLDDLLGEWVGTGEDSKERTDSRVLRITKEGGGYKYYLEGISSRGVVRVSYTLTIRSDGTIYYSGATVLENTTGIDYDFIDGIFTYDGKVLNSKGVDGSTSARYERKSAPPAPSATVKAGDIIPFGGYDWRVLDVKDGKALIISVKALSKTGGIAYNSELKSISWADCDLRKYLNGEFYNSTFSAAEKAVIADTNNINPANQWFGTAGGANTVDKVFCLSIEEVVKYFGDSGQLANRPAGQTFSQARIDDSYNAARVALSIDTKEGGQGSGWWLRSPGQSDKHGTSVLIDGKINMQGPNVHFATGSYFRPALWMTVGSAGATPAPTPTPTPSPAPTPTPGPGTSADTFVNPTPSKFFVNGAEKSLEVYNISGSNYFKLRDLAMVLNGTNKQFSIGYDNVTKAISITTRQPYAAVGGEMTPGDGKQKAASQTPSKIYIDSKELYFVVYNIGGNNFFKLRDLMSALDVAVTYDNVTKNIGVDTTKPYTD